MKHVLLALSFFVLTAHLQADEPASASASGSIVEIAGGIIHPNGVFTVLSYATPREIRLGDTGLAEAGLTAGEVPLHADEIRVFTNREATESAPLARIWINRREGGAYWFLTGGEGAAADFIIPQGAMVVVWTRAAKEPVTWSNVFD